MTNGILTVYKEKGYTSHDVVSKVRRLFGLKKVGHTGTLDPQAEGVLVICLGPATRVSSLLTEQDKTYEARVLLGVRTDTQDMTGRILKRCDTLPPPDIVTEAVMHFQGAYDQVPPMYSALKRNGRKLYELAREGTQVERQPRRVTIDGIQILSMDLPYLKLRVTCSKGTYIRTLCDDIGERLGCGAAMESLLRTRSGIFTLEDAVRLRVLEDAKAKGELENHVLCADCLFQDLPAVHYLPQAAGAARNGNRISSSLTDQGIPPHNPVRVRMYGPDGRFYGICESDPDGAFFRPVRILTDLAEIE